MTRSINNGYIKIFLAATALLVAVPLLAQQTSVPGVVALDAEATEEIREYRVELIIFEHMDNTTAGTEVFMPDEVPETLFEDAFERESGIGPEFGDARNADTPLPGLPQESAETIAGGVADPLDGDVLGVELSNTPEAPLEAVNYDDIELFEIPTYEQAGLRVLSPTEFELVDVYEKLVRLDAYRPIVHTAWTQPTVAKEDTAPIALRRLGDPPLRLDGTISLYLGRFLHLVVDLELEDRAAGLSSRTLGQQRSFGESRWDLRRNNRFDTPSIYYRIKEDRILRNGETRYYDHPKFGVVATVSRVEKESSESEAQAR